MTPRRWRALPRCALVLLTLLPALAACGPSQVPSVRADIKPYAKEVPTRQPLLLAFNVPMERTSVERGLQLFPSAVSQALEWTSPQNLTVKWRLDPGQKYLLKLEGARARDGKKALDWALHFTSAEPPQVAAVEVDGHPVVDGQRGIALRPQISVRFSQPMDLRAPTLTLDDRPVTEIAWSGDARTGAFTAPLAAAARHVLRWAEGARSRALEPPVGAWELGFFAVPALPANGHALTGNPMLVQVENSQPSRPQFGLQQADIVYEYLSEYEISRFTAVYFDGPPAVVGPVRSARLISIALQSMFHGALFSSGASGPVTRLLSGRPAYLGNAEAGFYREASRFAPHNLMIRGESLLQARQRFGDLQPGYAVDVAHPDVEWPGAAAATDVDVPVHQVHWHFVPEEQVYTRTDHGIPFVDGATGQPIKAKNVILQTVRWWPSTIVEDGCCTRGLEYQMVGEGEAVYLANGKMLSGHWRHASAGAPIEFLDSAGNPVPFNTGLTWINVR